jgi:hypothetical protein
VDGFEEFTLRRVMVGRFIDGRRAALANQKGQGRKSPQMGDDVEKDGGVAFDAQGEPRNEVGTAHPTKLP